MSLEQLDRERWAKILANIYQYPKDNIQTWSHDYVTNRNTAYRSAWHEAMEDLFPLIEEVLDEHQ